MLVRQAARMRRNIDAALTNLEVILFSILLSNQGVTNHTDVVLFILVLFRFYFKNLILIQHIFVNDRSKGLFAIRTRVFALFSPIFDAVETEFVLAAIDPGFVNIRNLFDANGAGVLLAVLDQGLPVFDGLLFQLGCFLDLRELTIVFVVKIEFVDRF